MKFLPLTTAVLLAATTVDVAAEQHAEKGWRREHRLRQRVLNNGKHHAGGGGKHHGKDHKHHGGGGKHQPTAAAEDMTNPVDKYIEAAEHLTNPVDKYMGTPDASALYIAAGAVSGGELVKPRQASGPGPTESGPSEIATTSILTEDGLESSAPPAIATTSISQEDLPEAETSPEDDGMVLISSEVATGNAPCKFCPNGLTLEPTYPLPTVAGLTLTCGSAVSYAATLTTVDATCVTLSLAQEICCPSATTTSLVAEDVDPYLGLDTEGSMPPIMVTGPVATEKESASSAIDEGQGHADIISIVAKAYKPIFAAKASKSKAHKSNEPKAKTPKMDKNHMAKVHKAPDEMSIASNKGGPDSKGSKESSPTSVKGTGMLKSSSKAHESSDHDVKSPDSKGGKESSTTSSSPADTKSGKAFNPKSGKAIQIPHGDGPKGYGEMSMMKGTGKSSNDNKDQSPVSEAPKDAKSPSSKSSKEAKAHKVFKEKTIDAKAKKITSSKAEKEMSIGHIAKSKQSKKMGSNESERR